MHSAASGDGDEFYVRARQTWSSNLTSLRIFSIKPPVSNLCFQVSAYAIVTEYGDTCNTVDVKFYMFSPYNYGKDVW